MCGWVFDNEQEKVSFTTPTGDLKYAFCGVSKHYKKKIRL